MKIYNIEKGIKLSKPVIGKSDGRPSRVALTLNAMKKGDSFLVSSELEAMKADKTVRDRNTRERARGGEAQFTTRRIDKGVRIWRVK